MHLELTNEQFKELLKAVVIGVDIREAVGEERETPGWEKIRDTETYLLSVAKGFGAEDMAESFDGGWIPSDDLANELNEELEEYKNEEFWERLHIDLAQREFARTITKEEKKFIADNGMYPGRMYDLYDKYSAELEKHGVDRLEIVVKKK